jgi:hypothetical protein
LKILRNSNNLPVLPDAIMKVQWNLPRHRRFWAFILSLIACVLAAMFLLRGRQPRPPPIIIFAQPYSFLHQKPSLFDRLLPQNPSWAWLWRMRYAVLGKPKSLTIDSAIVEFTSSADPLQNLSLRAPDSAGPGGVQVWLLDNAELKAVRRRLQEGASQNIMSHQVATGDRTESSIFAGFTMLVDGAQIPVGFSGQYSPRLRENLVDLTVALQQSETVTNEPPVRSSAPGATKGLSVRTNLTVAGRFQIPKDAAIFLISGCQGQVNSNRFGVVIAPRKN